MNISSHTEVSVVPVGYMTLGDLRQELSLIGEMQVDLKRVVVEQYQSIIIRTMEDRKALLRQEIERRKSND